MMKDHGFCPGDMYVCWAYTAGGIGRPTDVVVILNLSSMSGRYQPKKSPILDPELHDLSDLGRR